MFTVTVICTKIDAPNHRTPYLISQTLQNDSCDFLKELRDNFSDEFEFFIFKTSSRCNKTLLPKASHTGKVNKIYQQGGVSCLLAVIRQVRSTIKTDGQLMRSRIHGFDEFAESFLLYVMYTCTKFEKHTYIKICYIPGNLLNRHFAYHFMYLNNAETICL